MKKIVSLICALLLMVTFTSCKKEEVNEGGFDAKAFKEAYGERMSGEFIESVELFSLILRAPSAVITNREGLNKYFKENLPEAISNPEKMYYTRVEGEGNSNIRGYDGTTASLLYNILWELDYGYETLLILNHQFSGNYQEIWLKAVSVDGEQVNFLFDWPSGKWLVGQTPSFVTTFLVVREGELPSTDLRDFQLYSYDFQQENAPTKQASPYDGNYFSWH